MDIDRQREAEERLHRVIRYVRDGEGSLRTHLDEWAAFEFGGELLTRSGRQRWFNNPCPWREGYRLTRHMDWISSDAAAILRRGINRDLAVKKPKRGEPAPFRLIVEHAVPVKVIGDAVRADPGLWRTDGLRDFLHVHFKRGVLTSGEDAQLNTAGLRQSMPAGWRSGDNPFARYRAVGLQRAEVTLPI